MVTGLIVGLFIGAFIGAMGMALAAMAGMVTRDEELAALRRQQ